MKKAIATILRCLPRRRPRHWRYISPHRRGAGVVLAAILSVGVCAYWLLPRLIDDWTRAEAARYLRRITSARVRVAEAKFSLFGGIELRGVSIEAPNSPGRERFFYAETVVLRHRPWSLFTDRRLTPTEIVCIGPEVASEYDDQRGRYVWEDIVEAIGQYYRSPAVGRSKGALPVISFRDVHVRMLTGETWLNISMIPSPGVYRLMLEERRRGREPLRGTWRIDLQSGNVLLEEGAIPKIAQTDGILPQRYAKWRKWYNIEGKVVLKGGSAGADGSDPERDRPRRVEPARGSTVDAPGSRGHAAGLRLDRKGRRDRCAHAARGPRGQRPGVQRAPVRVHRREALRLR